MPRDAGHDHDLKKVKRHESKNERETDIKTQRGRRAWHTLRTLQAVDFASNSNHRSHEIFHNPSFILAIGIKYPARHRLALEHLSKSLIPSLLALGQYTSSSSPYNNTSFSSCRPELHVYYLYKCPLHPEILRSRTHSWPGKHNLLWKLQRHWPNPLQSEPLIVFSTLN